MSFNVFVDAGYPRDVAVIKALRSDLARAISGYIRRQGMTQVKAASVLGVPQPTVSKIINGRVSGLSIELLLRALVRVDIPIVLQTGANADNALAEINVGKDLAESIPARTSPPGHQPLLIPIEDLAFPGLGSVADSGTTKVRRHG